MKWIYCKRVINSSSNGERTEYRMKTSSVKEELFPCHRWGTTQGGWITSLRSHSRVGPRFKFGSGRGRFVLGKPGLHDPTSTWPSGLALISRLQCFVLFCFTFKITINTVPTLPDGDGGQMIEGLLSEHSSTASSCRQVGAGEHAWTQPCWRNAEKQRGDADWLQVGQQRWCSSGGTAG